MCHALHTARALAFVAVTTAVGTLGTAGCGAGAGAASNEPTAEEAALARRVADEVYERLREEGVLDSCGDEPAAHDGRTGPEESAETTP